MPGWRVGGARDPKEQAISLLEMCQTLKSPKQHDQHPPVSHFSELLVPLVWPSCPVNMYWTPRISWPLSDQDSSGLPHRWGKHTKVAAAASYAHDSWWCSRQWLSIWKTTHNLFILKQSSILIYFINAKEYIYTHTQAHMYKLEDKK